MVPNSITCKVEYTAWGNMKGRCYRPSCRDFHNYGGRGIQMCDRWRESFINFYSDMGDRPSPKHSIDRIDTHGNYTPENCRWATSKEQCHNMRRNNNYTHNGITKCLSQWASDTGIDRATLYQRLAYLSMEDAINMPRYRKKTAPTYEHGGETRTLAEWSRIINVSYCSLHNRIFKLKWSIEKTLTTPTRPHKTYPKRSTPSD